MTTAHEVALCTDVGEDSSCIRLFDLGAGMELKTFRDGVAGAHCIAHHHPYYFLAALQGKQLIHIWDKWKEQVYKRIVCPRKITALALSPDGNYCVVALSEKLYVWQVPTGNLMSILTKHYQQVTCLKFIDDGSHFLSGGDDSLVISWSMLRVLCPPPEFSDNDQSQNTLHIWSHHSLPVCDIFVGCGGIRCRVATASLDQTCKLYDFASGILLCSIVFDCGILAVAMDNAEYRLFAGGVKGNISMIKLFKPGIKKETVLESDCKNEKIIFKGHSKQVTSLAVTMDGCFLLSGSADGSCRFWHINSRQCVWTMNYKGCISNVAIIKTPNQLKESIASTKVLPPIGNFKRNLFEPRKDMELIASASDDHGSESDVPCLLKDVLTGGICDILDPTLAASRLSSDKNLFADVIRECAKPHGKSFPDGTGRALTRSELEDKVEELEKRNKELRQFITQRLMSKITEQCNQQQAST